MNDLISRTWLLAEYDKRHNGPPGGARKLIEEAPSALGTNLAEVGTDAVSREAVKELAYSQIRSMYCGVALKEQRETMLRIADNVIGLLAPVASKQPEIVRCKDCNHFYKDNLNQWCFLGKYGVKENDFCSRAERREVNNESN